MRLINSFTIIKRDLYTHFPYTMKSLIFSASIIIGTFYSVSGQQNFYQNQERIFRESGQQWLCRELSVSNKQQFECNNKTHYWQLPKEDSLRIFDHAIYIGDEERTRFVEMLFPGGNCAPYLRIISLCDLYFPLFKKECSNANIHDDFKFLPLILSGCNQSFEEGSRAGLWSMDFLVARKFHLRVDSLIDERKGGDFTTRAAIQYLADLQVKFDGDEFLSVVAYKQGAPLALQLDQANDFETFFQSLDENSRLFFQLLGYMKELISSTRTDNQLSNYFDIMANLEAIPIQKNIRMEGLCEILQLDRNQLKEYNPVYSGSFLESSYRKVPFMIDRVAALKFEALADSVYNWKPNEHSLSSTEMTEEFFYYKVKRGDSLGKIASKYGLSIREIKKWNNLKGDKISRGQKLKLARQVKKVATPVSDKIVEVTQDTTKTESQPKSKSIVDHTVRITELNAEADKFMTGKKYQQAISRYEEILKLEPANEPAAMKLTDARKRLATSKAAAEKAKITYVVKSGDSLWKIARKYPGVTEKEIMKWNKCDADIRPGQKLIIHTGKK